MLHAPRAPAVLPACLPTPACVRGCSPRGCELLATVARVATAMQGISCWHGRADCTGDESNVSFYRNSLAALVHPSSGSS